MIDARAGHNVLQSRLDAALQSWVFFCLVNEEFERLGGRRQRRSAVLTTAAGQPGARGEDFSHLKSRTGL